MVDIKTVTKEELSFKIPFTLKALRNDNVHAFVVYFDIWFSQCHKPIHFSTGPHAKYTHWKQTVFYLNDALMVSPGDQMKGALSCKPNNINPRDLDIVINYDFQGKLNSVDNRQEYFLR